MGQAIAVRTDFTASEVRRFAKRAKDAAQARRLLAIAAVLDGASREDAAKIGGMDRQTLRDWVIRFNEQGPDGLINIPSPGVPPKLGKKHRAFLLRLVEQGPIPAVHGVVRWRGCDLIMRLHEEFDISVSDDTIYRALKDLGFAMNFGKEFGVPLDLASMTNQTFMKGKAAYGGSAQSTQIAKLLEDVLDTDLRAPGFPARLE